MKKILKIFITGLLLSILISPLRSGTINLCGLTGFSLSSIVGFCIYFFIIIYFLKNKKRNLSIFWTVMSLISGTSIISLSFHLMYFQHTKVSLLELLIHLCGVILGFIFYQIKNIYWKGIILILSFTFCFWISTYGYTRWLHKVNFGNFTGKVNDQPNNIFLLQLQNSSGDGLTLVDFKDKYLLLDCWYSYCPICYKAMPKLQELYDKYKERKDIHIYTLHSRMEYENETYSTGLELLNKEGYTLPTLSINIEDPILKALEIKVYPTVLIFDKNSTLVYRGNIEFAEKYLEHIFSSKN